LNPLFRSETAVAYFNLACRRSESKLRCAAMTVFFSERLQIVYSKKSSKYKIEKEAEEEQLSTIEFINSF